MLSGIGLMPVPDMYPPPPALVRWAMYLDGSGVGPIIVHTVFPALFESRRNRKII